MKTIHDILKELNACSEGLDWAKKYDTIEEIVENVERGDWLLWLGAKLDLPIEEITLAKARCAKTVLHLMKDERSKKAVEVAESFGLGKVTRAELNSAYADAYIASDAVADSYDDAAYAAYAASDAANATSAAYASDAVTADEKNRKVTADICREVLGNLIIKEINDSL